MCPRLRYLWLELTRGSEYADRERLLDTALRASEHPYAVLIDKHDAEAVAMKALMHEACTCLADGMGREVVHGRNRCLEAALARALHV